MIELKAPKGKFRVVGVDTFSHDAWVSGDFDTKNKAIEHADSKGGEMLKTYVYDDMGRHIHEAGKF